MSLFDHLVCACEQRGWDAQSERLRGLEIDYEFDLCRRLHRKIARFLAPEDAIDIAGRATELIEPIRPIGDQAAGGGLLTTNVNCRQLVLGRKPDEQIAMTFHRATGHDQAAIGIAGESGNVVLDLLRVAYVNRAHINPERRSCGADSSELGDTGGIYRISKDGYLRQSRHDLPPAILRPCCIRKS